MKKVTERNLSKVERVSKSYCYSNGFRACSEEESVTPVQVVGDRRAPSPAVRDQVLV